ncbi:MAG TPA: ROK family protein [Actinomycetes bacterium]|nr:ROK family protein [Actinomycetes bacterium]
MTTAHEDARPYAIGVRVNPDELTGVIIDLDGQLVRFGGGTIEAGVIARGLRSSSPATVVDGVATLRDELLAAAGDLGGPVVGLGVVVGGHVHGDTGEVHLSPNLGWEAVPLGRLLVEATGLVAVNVENDTKTLAVAEQLFGDGIGRRSFAVVGVRAGVSCGLVLDHEVYGGATGLAGELGHFVFEPGGDPCRCGGRGCLETIASRTAMLDAVRAAGRPSPASIDELAALARQGDDIAKAAIERAGEALGRGIAMLLNLLNLELVLLYAEEPLVETPAYLQSVQTSLKAHAFSSAASDCRIIQKVLTDIEEARAGASMAFQRFYSA